ncbi:hypothetical protein C8R48DRAFT_739519 [Suillus tomentosus]|nr:hypothetical protein C8R48DRAFT_739519 [Suillus tomentosus]
MRMAQEIVCHACHTRSFSHIAERWEGCGQFLQVPENNNMKFRGGGTHRPYYANFCSIAQSSGTGKSRLMSELWNKGVIVLLPYARPSARAYIWMKNTGCAN